MNAVKDQAEGSKLRFPIRTYDLRLRWWLLALAAAAAFVLEGQLTGWDEALILLHIALGTVCCGLLAFCIAEFFHFLSGHIILEPGGIRYRRWLVVKRYYKWADIGCILLLNGYAVYPVNGFVRKLPPYGFRDSETGRIWYAPAVCLMARTVDFGEEIKALRQRRAAFIRFMIRYMDQEYNPCQNLLRRLGRESFLRLEYRDDLMDALLTRIDCPVLCTPETYRIYEQWLNRFADNPRLIRVEERDPWWDSCRDN